MSLNSYFDGLDSFDKVGRFFVKLTERLGEGELTQGEDVAKISRIVGVPMPRELAGASIVAAGTRESDEPVGEVAESIAKEGRTPIVATYPTTLNPPPESGPVTTALTLFHRCFSISERVNHATVTTKVCVTVTTSGGSVTATVSVAW